MSMITVDGVNYETELFTVEGQAIVKALMESEFRLREATMTVTLMQASSMTLVDDLKTNHLTEEAIAAEDAAPLIEE
jgi:hypothetical protein|tara:strand:+ start:1546 stop:1776 length:231 start_codon:yes stop_codon:yes gene_type:complete